VQVRQFSFFGHSTFDEIIYFLGWLMVLQIAGEGREVLWEILEETLPAKGFKIVQSALGILITVAIAFLMIYGCLNELGVIK
jgi:TRAP-type C4-dicarboxylate transport system permease small subunit